MSARLDRALQERFFFLDYSIPADGGWISAEVEGSRGLPYRLLFKEDKNTCSCPDYTRRRANCKHILFVVGRVCGDREKAERLAAGETLDVREVLRTRFRTIHTGAPLEYRSVVAEKRPRSVSPPRVQRELEEGEDCPICFEGMQRAESLRQCRSSCGRYFHTGCIGVWLQRSRKCPLCRAPFDR